MSETNIKDSYVAPRQYGRRGFSYLTLEQRRILEIMLKAKRPIKDIAQGLGITRGTIYYERMRMGDLNTPYNAEQAHQDALESRRVARLRKTELPKKHVQSISRLYRNMEALMQEPLNAGSQLIVEECHRILESMGANPDKMKRPLSVAEEMEIIELWKKGTTYSDIERKMNRSRSTISSVISQHRNDLNKPTQELEYEHLTSKWVTE